MPNLDDAEAYIRDNGTVASKLDTARAMIEEYVGEAYVPESVLNEATLALAQELFTRQKSPGGFVQFGGSEVAGRLSRDPMEPIRPMLKPWLSPFA
ncbi:hypothetical protein ACTOB_003046 [Actinoplanes oblitus]|uniref:Uncharacterized protein n=1 Tax=Actinoplanes oblitus TaxID=3040509 RepID=A0ABY8WRC7_9ACTN|nr:hypothetical protein [Actinoplanes oblitus]WIM99395.1 hypothetical protein ACTOB_003046 [Actinoplanes oblitus]